MSEATENTFQFELVSPARKLSDMPAYQVIVPGQDGEFGVRKGHSSFVISMRAGVVEILKSEEAEPERIFVAGGFADISAENCTVLAEEAVAVQDIDTAAVEEEITSLESHLVAEQDHAEQKRLSHALHVAQAKLTACQ